MSNDRDLINKSRNYEGKKVFPDVKPGFLRSILKDEPPRQPESFDKMLEDVEKVMIGKTVFRN